MYLEPTPTRDKISRIFLQIVLATAYLSATVSFAQAAEDRRNQADSVRLNTPSGYPVPRFVSLKRPKTDCRIGPSFDHPVRFTFLQAGAPVLVIAETTDHWRKIRDLQGDECWTHKVTLKARSHVIILADAQLHAKPNGNAPVRGKLAKGVLASVQDEKSDWIYLSAGGAKGWTEIKSIWGAGAP